MSPKELAIWKERGGAPAKLVTVHGARQADSLEPERMQFRPAPARGMGDCSGCVFARQDADVCYRAVAAAIRAGYEDCDTGVIYILRAQDPRQLDLVEDV